MRYCCGIQQQGKHGVLVSAKGLPVSLESQEQEGRVRQGAPRSGSFPRGLQVPLR